MRKVRYINLTHLYKTIAYVWQCWGCSKRCIPILQQVSQVEGANLENI